MESATARLYDLAILAAIHEAFEATWSVLQAHEQSPSSKERNAELGIALSRILVALAAEGIIDPAELRSRALLELPLALMKRMPLDRRVTESALEAKGVVRTERDHAYFRLGKRQLSARRHHAEVVTRKLPIVSFPKSAGNVGRRLRTSRCSWSAR